MYLEHIQLQEKHSWLEQEFHQTVPISSKVLFNIVVGPMGDGVPAGTRAMGLASVL